MKKKLLALLCVLSVLVGVLAATATAAETISDDTFYVGYAMVDINPYFEDGDINSGIMPVPLRGLGTPTARLSFDGKVDDNGDGEIDKVDEDGNVAVDGLFLTCIAISKDPKNFKDGVLLFTMDAIGDMGHTALARNAIVNELGAEYGITADRVMVSGTHAHSSIDLTSLTQGLYNIQQIVDDDGKVRDYDGKTIFGYLNTWCERLTGYKKYVEVKNQNSDGTYTFNVFEDRYTNSNNYFVQAATKAIKDFEKATITKTQIEVNESAAAKDKPMNFVRNYVATDNRNQYAFVTDGYSNDNILDANGKYVGTIQGHVSEADQTLHAIKFDVENTNSKKQDIVLINWRNHPQFSSSKATKYRVSSDYINAFRYTMDETYGYRAAFFQGTGGNTQPSSKLADEQWIEKETTGGASTSLKRGHIYGKLLADVTNECLKGTTTKTSGKVRTMQVTYAANRVQYTKEQYDAALAAKEAENVAVKNGQKADSVYPFYYNADSDATIDVVISDLNQTAKIIEHYKNYNDKNLKTIDLEIDAIMIGSKIAIVTCPGEPFDRYSQTAADEIKEIIKDENRAVTHDDYREIANKYNDWDNLISDVYGEPLIFGYTNQHVTYIPNALAYNYNAEHPELYSTQSYESFMTPLAEGEGERMVANLGKMLDTMASTEPTYCQNCKRNVDWYPLNEFPCDVGAGHCYLTDDIQLTKNIKVKTSMCIDLAGYKIHNNQDIVSANVFDVAAGATLTIFDSSATENSLGTGEVKGTNNTGSGGAISVGTAGTVNIYGGKYYSAATYDPDKANEKGTMYGGAIWSKGIVNVYGGEIRGSQVLRGSGAICLHNSAAALNVYGGKIIENKNGSCIGFRVDKDNSVANVVIQVGGDAVVGKIEYLQSVMPTVDTFKIVDSPVDNNSKTPFTGRVTLKASGIKDNTVVGSVSVPFGKGAFITTSNGFDIELNKDNQLVATEAVSGEAGIVVNGMVTSSGTLAEAIAKANAGEGDVILGADVENLTISKNITIDLNGRNINNVTVASGVTLSLKDSKTDDFFVGDCYYGVVKNVSGKVVAAENYLAITEEDGTSYHGYEMKLDKVTLRPGRAGMYYTAGFDGDAMVVSQIESFGTALRIGQAPNASSMNPGQYTAFTPEEYGVVQAKSTVLVDIMQATNVFATNKQNAETEIYGSAYIKLKDSSYLFSDAEHYSLKTLAEEASKRSVDELKENADLMELYRKYSAVMSDWNIQNIKDAFAASQKEEDETLKVLLIGNSHSLDSFHMLYDVIEAEGIPEDNSYGAKSVELGVMYFSGCRMRKHAEHARGDVAAYDFHRVGPSTNGEWVETPDTTLKMGLQAERWDIVVFQEMNMEEGLFVDTATSIAVNSTQYVYSYVRNILGYTPKFMWNMIWSNPTIPDCCDTTKYTTDTQYRTKWIYKIARPAYAGQLDGYYSWEDRAMAFYSNDPQSQYNQTVDYLQDHIIGRFGIRSAENVVTPGTTMMYALYQQTLDGGTYNLLANEKFAYRDYTHLSDVSRVMVSYLWYAELFGLDRIDSVNYSVIPANMRETDKTADIVLDANMQKNIVDAVNYTLNNPFGAYTGE